MEAFHGTAKPLATASWEVLSGKAWHHYHSLPHWVMSFYHYISHVCFVVRQQSQDHGLIHEAAINTRAEQQETL
jgi:hypothetical protein